MCECAGLISLCLKFGPLRLCLALGRRNEAAAPFEEKVAFSHAERRPVGFVGSLERAEFGPDPRGL